MSSGCATQIIRQDKYSTETDFLQRLTNVRTKFFIIDQAYALYSVKTVLSVDDVWERENIVVLNS